MKVLHLVKTSIGATWAYRQMRELVRLGVEVHVALPTPGHLEETYRQADMQVHIADVGFSAKNLFKTREAIQNLRSLVGHIQPDLVHSHFVNTTVTMRLALRKMPIPRIFQVPGPLHLEFSSLKRAEIALSTQNDYWIGSCRWTQNTYLKAGVPPHRVFMSFYGGDLPDTTLTRGKLRRELGLADQDWLVGMVAFMYAPKRFLGQSRGLKGHEDLIDALSICREQGLPVMGVFVGGAWDGALAYEESVRAYGKARLGDAAVFLGTRGDVIQLYPDFDVAVHPSHSENLGGAGESLSLAVPTIATNVGGFPDIVIPGQTGWLVPPKDPATLAQTIRYVLTHPEEAKQSAQAGRELVMNALLVETTAKQIADIYAQVIQARR